MATINSVADYLQGAARPLTPKRGRPRSWLTVRLLTTLLSALLPPFVFVQAVFAADTLAPPVYYFLTPGAPTTVKLHTHTADIDLAFGADSAFAAVDALYRLQNAATEATVVVLQINADPSADTGLQDTLPDNLVILVNEQPIALTVNDEGSTVAQVQVPPDTTLDVRLTYAIPFAAGPLATLRYDPRLLSKWPGSPSLRVSIGVPDVLPEESWLRVEPTGWNFAPDANGATRIRWLYDERLSGDAMLFTFIQPNAWQALQNTAAAATPGAGSAPFLALGDLYRDLHDAAISETVRQRFYAQAVAAYSAGLDEVKTGAVSVDSAALHIGLTTLYRSRAIGGDGAIDRTYMALMANEAGKALAALPANAPAVSELQQWQVEGLTLQLNDARDRQDWPDAFALIEQLATLPPTIVDASKLAETRRALIAQQALQLLEQGDNEAAMQLVGPQIDNIDLMPPANARPLFATWQVTATLAPTQIDLLFTVLPAMGRAAEARSTLHELVQTWQQSESASDIKITLPQEISAPDGQPLQLLLTMPASGGGSKLARAIPPGADWALLRTLLAQLGPQVERRSQLFKQQLHISQPLDLRSTDEQWRNIAATLTQQAEQFEAQSPNINLADASTAAAEGALTARIKAANYRGAAQIWRDLAHNSLVVVQMSAGVGVPPVTRTWLATPETPLQVLELDAEVISLGRLLVLSIFGLGGLFLLAGALWWLL